MTFSQHISRPGQPGAQKDTIYLGANDDLPISWDKERAERILTVHCPDALQGRSVDKGRAQNLLAHTKPGPLSETCSTVASAHAIFSAGARRYTTTIPL